MQVPNLNSFFKPTFTFSWELGWINVSLKVTHDFGGFSPFLLTNGQWYHQSCLPPHRRTHSAKVCSVIVCGCERRASEHFWILLKAQVVLRSNSKPTFLRTAFQFPRRNCSPPSVSLSTLPTLPRPLKPRGPMSHTFEALEPSTVLCSFVPEVLV